jgi:hypothetical protein
MHKAFLGICLAVAFTVFAPYSYCRGGETDVTITLPEEVGEAPDRVGVHIETPQEKRESAWMQAAMIGGGIIVAGVIIALVLKRRE